MSVQAQLSISGDLARVAERIAASADLAPVLCDRLTRALGQLWSAGRDGFASDDVESFDAILLRVAPAATRDARADLSDRIARSPTPPRAVLLVLAHDAIEIAGPILRFSPALGEEDLVDIARRCGLSHMGAIAERPELSVRVTDVLVLRGDDGIRRLVTANAGARLSDKSFARLSLQARDDTAVGLILVARADLPDLVVRFLQANAAPEVCRALEERELAPRTDDVAVHVARSIRLTEEGWLEPYDFEAAASVLRRLSDARHQLDTFVRKLAQTDHFAEVVHVLAAVAGLPLEHVKHMMVALDTGPFVVLARALGLKSDTVQEILMIGPWLHRLDPRAREATLLAWTTVDSDEARATLRRWAHPQH